MPIWKDEISGEDYNTDNLPLEVCHSGAGYYIGLLEPTSRFPVARISSKYWATSKEANTALERGFALYESTENTAIITGLMNKGTLCCGD